MIPVDNHRASLTSTTIDMTSNSIAEISSDQSMKNHINQNKKSIGNISTISVGQRIEKRKDLYNRLCQVNNAMCFFGLWGVILMIIDNEISFNISHNEDNVASWFIRLIISISTAILIGLIFYYHYLDLEFYSIKNSIDDWRIGLTIKKIFLIILEILICSIHPFPRQFYSNWNSNSIMSDTLLMSYISVDIALSLPSKFIEKIAVGRMIFFVEMFARLYLICRFLMFHSYLNHNASSKSLCYLNQVSIDISFLIKTYIDQWPARCLLIFCTCLFFIGSWSLRACDYTSTGEHMPIFNSMWLFIVTFTTLGYGDLTPTTYCGRSVAATICLIGVLSTALLISVLAQKLILNRWEKYVHNFILDIKLAKERKDQSANIIKYAIRVWYLKRNNKLKSIKFMKSKWKLFQSIRTVQEIKLEQRKLIDNCIGLIDIFNIQRNEDIQIEKFTQEIKLMKNTIENIEENFININKTMNNIQNTLDILVNKI